MRVKMTFAVLAMATLALAVPASSTAHRTATVKAGESIQAAIDAAKPGTTIKIEAGTYAESLLVSKDGIELVGAGRKQTHIVPPANPTVGQGCVFPPNPGSTEPFVGGICVSDAEDPAHIVKDVEVSHLSVAGFGINIFLIGTKNNEITRVISSGYDEYGIFANSSSGTTIARSVTGNSDPEAAPEAGIYVGDSPHADATLWKNVSYGNHDGFFIRDAAHGSLLKNKSFGNCIGIVFLNTDETTADPPGDPVDVADWLAQDNLVAGNNKECAPFETAPPLSGIGIGVLGSVNIRLIDNGIYGNDPRDAFGSAFSGGVVVTASPEFTPPKPSTGIKVGFNQVLGNETDLVLDEGNDAKLFANDCLTSKPDGLCEDPDVHGDDNGGDRGDDGGHHGGENHHGDKHHKSKKHNKSSKHKNGKHKNKKHYKHHDD